MLQDSLNEMPVMKVGKFKGVRVDQLPMSYLRWLITQDFPPEIVEIAKKKIDGSDYYNDPISVTRHAIDTYSKRFINRWLETLKVMKDDTPGLATFIAMAAKEAWEHGSDTTLKRFTGEGIRRDFKGIRWVFNTNPRYPELKDVITVMVVPKVSIDKYKEVEYTIINN